MTWFGLESHQPLAVDLAELHGEARREARWGASGIFLSFIAAVYLVSDATATALLVFMVIFGATLHRWARWRRCQDELVELAKDADAEDTP